MFWLGRHLGRVGQVPVNLAPIRNSRHGDAADSNLARHTQATGVAMNAVHYLLMMVDLDNPAKPFAANPATKRPSPIARVAPSATTPVCSASATQRPARAKRPASQR
ncbi:hypothetical protein C7S18_03000 [Ahniella affigens]|uniref:Uncharacterized protein n=1 Tax=Ahniella affigens TaxID=2021234 RepID=A0A2P1PMZ7_9GAMM|nr:hypothetical protein C7S18_03000 [Ahniella affigens]